MISNLIMVIVFSYTHVSNHHIIHLKHKQYEGHLHLNKIFTWGIYKRDSQTPVFFLQSAEFYTQIPGHINFQRERGCQLLSLRYVICHSFRFLSLSLDMNEQLNLDKINCVRYGFILCRKELCKL